MLVIRCELIQPSEKVLSDLLHEVRQDIGNGCTDGVQQHLHRHRPSSVPWKVHVLGAMNHGTVGLFHEQRTFKQTVEHHFGLLLSAQTRHQSRSCLQKSIVMVQHAGFPCIVRRANSPNGVEGVFHHERCALFGNLLVGRVQSDKIDVGAHQLIQERIDGRNGCFVQGGKQHLNVAFASQPRVKHPFLTVTNRGRTRLAESMANTCFQFRSRFPRERDGHNLGRQKPRPCCQVGALSLWRSKCAVTRKRGAWTRGRDMNRTLVARNEVLNVALRHHGGFSSASTGIQRNVSVQIQAQPLTVVEINRHKPPSRSVDAAHECAMGQYWQCLPGVGLMCPWPALPTARSATRIRSNIHRRNGVVVPSSPSCVGK